VPLLSEKSNNILLQVKVIPGSPVNKVSHIHDERMVIKVKAPPEKGKANKELVIFLSKLLGVSRSMIFVVQGETSHHKLLMFPASCKKALQERLSALKIS